MTEPTTQSTTDPPSAIPTQINQEASTTHTPEVDASGTAKPPSQPTTATEPPPPQTSPTANGVPATATTEPKWPDLSPSHPLTQLNQRIPDLVAQSSYSELYGIELGDSASPCFARNLVLQKFLRANANDVDKAAKQLLETLRWRKDFDPRGAATEMFSQEKFGGLGYITRLRGVPGSAKAEDIATFNIYGSVQNSKTTFGDTEAFLRWRVALMELSIAALDLPHATTPIPDYGHGPDPHQGLQIHDYMGVSFWRQDPLVKAASKEAIATFAKYYPETLSRKFMVNVPAVMGWVFSAMKMFMAAETVRKITFLTDGKTLAGELGEDVSGVYGGTGAALEETGETPKMV